MSAILGLVKPRQSVVEVGAHIGYLTMFFSHLVGPGGRVYAFEPGTANLKYLRKNAAPCPNVKVFD
jgi:FkbM family methyltransferase